MAQKPLTKVRIDKHAGVNQNSSAHRLVQHMQSQENVTNIVPGQLTVRPGMVPATFSGGGTATTNDIIAMTVFRHPRAKWVVWQDSAGAIYGGSDPA